MDEKTKKLIDFALCYLLSNSDDESVIEIFEQLTNSERLINWADFIQEAQMEIWGGQKDTDPCEDCKKLGEITCGNDIKYHTCYEKIGNE